MHSFMLLSQSITLNFVKRPPNINHNYRENNEQNDDGQALNPSPTPLVYVLLMTSRSIADEVTNALRDATIVTRVHDKFYLTR